jgi:DNA modification methylase/ParB-like chromosome segregation protein Spo0J
MSSQNGRISIYDLNHPEEDQDPRTTRSGETIDRLKGRLQNQGLLSPIIYTSDDRLIVDGNTRVQVLSELDNETGEYEHLHVLGEYEGYTFAVPANEIRLDPEEASAELNLFRENLSQADRAKFLGYLIQTRIIDNDDFCVARDATATKLLIGLEQGREWEYGEEAKQVLKEILDVLDFDSAQNARRYLTQYENAPEMVRREWSNENLDFSHVEELNNVYPKLDEGTSLSELNSVSEGHSSFSDLVEHSKEDYRYGSDDYYTRDDLRKLAEQLDCIKSAPDDEPEEIDTDPEEDPSEDQLDQFRQKLEESGYIEKAQTFADLVNEDLDLVVENLYRVKGDGRNYQKVLDKSIQEIKEKRAQRPELLNQSIEEYAFENTPFRKYDESGGVPHGHVPLLINKNGYLLDADSGINLEDIELATFFHDNKQMDLEVPDSEDGFFHLMFFSPPYFDQSGSMPVDQWLPEGVSEIIDERTLDETYENYLDWMIERLKIFTRNLKPGRALIINVSDTSTSNIAELDEDRFDQAPEKRYHVPADLSYRLTREIDELVYDSTIQWFKKTSTSQRGGQYWGDKSEGSRGYPLYYYPQDTTEELLIFRRSGKPDHPAVIEEASQRFDREFITDVDFQKRVRYEEPNEPFERNIDERCGSFDNYRKNVWKIEQDNSGRWEHDASFPRELPKLVIELYTLPGERIADPFGGYGTTLKAVQAVNDERPDLPRRQGFSWESLDSEEIINEDFIERMFKILSKQGLAHFVS